VLSVYCKAIDHINSIGKIRLCDILRRRFEFPEPIKPTPSPLGHGRHSSSRAQSLKPPGTPEPHEEISELKQEELEKIAKFFDDCRKGNPNQLSLMLEKSESLCHFSSTNYTKSSEYQCIKLCKSFPTLNTYEDG